MFLAGRLTERYNILPKILSGLTALVDKREVERSTAFSITTAFFEHVDIQVLTFFWAVCFRETWQPNPVRIFNTTFYKREHFFIISPKVEVKTEFQIQAVFLGLEIFKPSLF